MQRDDRLRNRAELGIRTEHIYTRTPTRLHYPARLRARVKMRLVSLLTMTVGERSVTNFAPSSLELWTGTYIY